MIAPEVAAGSRAPNALREQRRERLAGILGAHERLADEERVDALCAQHRHIGRREDAAPRDDERSGGHARKQVDGRRGEVSNVRRLRLLMPTSGVAQREPHARARLHRGLRRARPSRSRARARRSEASCASSSAATISRIASAPIARDSAIWYGSTMKSLRSTGSAHASRAALRYSGAPWKYSRSVSTDRHAAPPAA